MLPKARADPVTRLRKKKERPLIAPFGPVSGEKRNEKSIKVAGDRIQKWSGWSAVAKGERRQGKRGAKARAKQSQEAKGA